MKRKIIITDLTRFAPGKPIVCTAGIDPETGECIRPLPYLAFSAFTQLGIFPGGILSGEFTRDPACIRPHVEDSKAEGLKFLGPCTSEEFQAVLRRSAFRSLEAGFEVKVESSEKCIPTSTPPARSIITLRAEPESVKIVEDGFKPGKIRLHFADESGENFRFFPIADLGFYDYAQRHRESGAMDDLNSEIAKQRDVYLRIGLGRAYTNPQGKTGFWLQANGIYTFPNKLTYIRSYEPESKPTA